MSKLQCTCGHVISDITDSLRYKASFIADQDMEEYMDQIEQKEYHQIVYDTMHFWNTMFQCTSCGNIILFNKKGRFDFSPVHDHSSQNVLMSVYGENWKGGYLYADFKNDSGEVYWYTNADEGSKRNLSLDNLRRFYHDKQKELLEKNILASSRLKVNNEVEHEYRS
jgi:hypothetical protein